jgi:tRNA(Ile)-lysidine synthase
LSWARRRETENYCQARKIEYRCDPMNDDPGFRRVRVRKVLLPILAEFNPKIVETLARTATLMGDDSEIRESLTDQEPFAEKEFLELKALRTLLKPKLYQMLRKWLAVNRGNLRGLDLKHIEAIERLISSRGSGRLIELPGGESILKKNGKLFFQRTKVEKRRSAN